MFPCYIVVNKGEKDQDIEKFLLRFNDSENKEYLYAWSLVGKKEGRKEIVMELKRNFSSLMPGRNVRRYR